MKLRWLTVRKEYANWNSMTQEWEFSWGDSPRKLQLYNESTKKWEDVLDVLQEIPVDMDEQP